MKNHFKQRIPNWVSGVEPVEFDFETQEQLLAHENISRWKGRTFSGSFVRYSISKSKTEYGLPKLMAEYEGEAWWVVGYLKHLEGITLPDWQPPRKEGI